MKNIAIINVSDFGSTGKIALGFHRYLLEKGYNSFFCYGRGREPLDNTFFKCENETGRHIHALATRITGKQGFYSKKATRKLIRFLEQKKIDTIYGECLHGYYLNEPILYKFISDNNIRFVYIMIDEYAYLGKCWNISGCEGFLTGCGNCPKLKEYPKSLFFDRSAFIFNNKLFWYSQMRNLIFVGPEYVIKNSNRSPLTKEMNRATVDFGIDTAFYKPQNTIWLREKLQISKDAIVLFSTAPIGSSKGGHHFLNIARSFEKDKRFVFIHAGNKIKPENTPINYIFAGFLPGKDLPAYYSMADLFIFPSTLDTMPNACIEAISCGTPLLCFNCSGMPYLAGEDIEMLVAPENLEQMKNVVSMTKRKTTSDIQRCREYAVKRYDSSLFYSKLIELGG